MFIILSLTVPFNQLDAWVEHIVPEDIPRVKEFWRLANNNVKEVSVMVSKYEERLSGATYLRYKHAGMDMEEWTSCTGPGQSEEDVPEGHISRMQFKVLMLDLAALGHYTVMVCRLETKLTRVAND